VGGARNIPKERTAFVIRNLYPGVGSRQKADLVAVGLEQVQNHAWGKNCKRKKTKLAIGCEDTQKDRQGRTISRYQKKTFMAKGIL